VVVVVVVREVWRRLELFQSTQTVATRSRVCPKGTNQSKELFAFSLPAHRLQCCRNSSLSTNRLHIPSLNSFTALTIFVLNTQAMCFLRSGNWIQYIIRFRGKLHPGYSYTWRYSIWELLWIIICRYEAFKRYPCFCRHRSVLFCR